MKYQVLFSLKSNKNYSRLSSAAVVIGALKAARYAERRPIVFADSKDLGQQAHPPP